MAEHVHTLIIGAGVVGAGVAYALRSMSDRIYVVEAEARPCTGMSSRNSGVIHAGLYYPGDSLKMRLCRRGAQLLYAFAARHGIAHQKTGKYIVANQPEELAYLDWLKNHVHGVPLREVAHPPDGIRAKRALFSPNTGIVEVHALVERLLDQSGANLVFNQKVESLAVEKQGVLLRIAGEEYLAERVVNCAGLHAAAFAPKQRHFYARGSYFQVKIPAGVDPPHLVYPAVPKGSAGLGIHLTRNMFGEAYLGPDVEWIDREDYSVDEGRRLSFFRAAKTYLPWLEPELLGPGYAGIRAKLKADGFADFMLAREGGQYPVIHCLGIESPGLTAAMAIGERVAAILEGNAPAE